MTLRQWLTRNPVAYLTTFPSGCTRVHSLSPELWRLTDYAVSTVSCGGVYLTPRSPNNAI